MFSLRRKKYSSRGIAVFAESNKGGLGGLFVLSPNLLMPLRVLPVLLEAFAVLAAGAFLRGVLVRS